jgi:hypothetical protein
MSSASAYEMHALRFLEAEESEQAALLHRVSEIIGTHVHEGKNNHYDVQKIGA